MATVVVVVLSLSSSIVDRRLPLDVCNNNSSSSSFDVFEEVVALSQSFPAQQFSSSNFLFPSFSFCRREYTKAFAECSFALSSSFSSSCTRTLRHVHVPGNCCNRVQTKRPIKRIPRSRSLSLLDSLSLSCSLNCSCHCQSVAHFSVVLFSPLYSVLCCTLLSWCCWC